ncbi:hypothetical protein VP1G_10850 [Cytospora mali]|uniref:Uncharacterized protein n=1 Tax=Cytospora mali TaxID=578113 RepID=A0A194UYV9_CYTMA|nr:hypothetical protein VP1G_10850 [Valsa mali var. pyri (nom. inval.)]
MPLLRQTVPGHDPDSELALEHSPRHPDLTGLVDLLIQLLRQLIPPLLRLRLRSHPEHSQGKDRPRQHLKQVPPPLHQPSKQLPQLDAPPDILLQAPDAVVAHDEPDLQGAEPPPQGDLPVPVVGHEAAVAVRVAVDVQLRAHGLLQPAAVGHEQAGRVEVGQQPLVHVGVERVEPPQVVHAHGRLRLGRHQRRPRVRRVDVHPHLALLPGRDLVVGVGGGAPLRRAVAVGDRGEATGLRQRGARQGVIRRRRDGDSGVPHAEDLGSLLGRRVTSRTSKRDHPAPLPHGQVIQLLLADLPRGRERLAEVLIPRGDHHSQDRLGGSTLDDAPAARGPRGAVRGGQAQGAGEPVEHDGLELGDGGGADPVEAGAGEGGRVQLAQEGRVGGRAGEEGEEVGGLPVGEAGDDLGVDVLPDHVPWLALLGRGVREDLAEVAWLDLRDYAVKDPHRAAATNKEGLPPPVIVLVAELNVDGDDGGLGNGDDQDERDNGQEPKHIVVSGLVRPDRLEDEEQLDEDYCKGYEACKQDGSRSLDVPCLLRNLPRDQASLSRVLPSPASGVAIPGADVDERKLNEEPQKQEGDQSSEWDGGARRLGPDEEVQDEDEPEC